MGLGPVVDALPNTTYYAYRLNSCVPKVILEGHFQKQQARERRMIGACAWVEIAKSKVAGYRWRREDEMLLKQWRQEEEHKTVGGG